MRNCLPARGCCRPAHPAWTETARGRVSGAICNACGPGASSCSRIGLSFWIKCTARSATQGPCCARSVCSLAAYMLRFDAVTFMSYLDNLRATEGVKSVWLFHSGGGPVGWPMLCRPLQKEEPGRGLGALFGAPVCCMCCVRDGSLVERRQSKLSRLHVRRLPQTAGSIVAGPGSPPFVGPYVAPVPPRPCSCPCNL